MPGRPYFPVLGAQQSTSSCHPPKTETAETLDCRRSIVLGYSLSWLTHPSKLPLPSNFSGQRLNFLSSTLFRSSTRSSAALPSAPRPVTGMARMARMAGFDALKLNRTVASLVLRSDLIPFRFFFEYYLVV